MLADKRVEMRVVDGIDPATVWRTLKKKSLEPWLRQQWVIPRAGAVFVAAMKDVLDTYANRSARPARSCAWTRAASN